MENPEAEGTIEWSNYVLPSKSQTSMLSQMARRNLSGIRSRVSGMN
jgi:hypothetical protein